MHASTQQTHSNTHTHRVPPLRSTAKLRRQTNKQTNEIKRSRGQTARKVCKTRVNATLVRPGAGALPAQGVRLCRNTRRLTSRLQTSRAKILRRQSDKSPGAPPRRRQSPSSRLRSRNDPPARGATRAVCPAVGGDDTLSVRRVATRDLSVASALLVKMLTKQRL